MATSDAEPKVTGTVIHRPFVADPTSDSPVARIFADVLERASPIAPVRVSLELSRTSSVSSWTFMKRDGDGTSEELLTMPTKLVRTLLAYVGFSPMCGQMYGGYMRRPIEVGDKLYSGVFYLSNEGISGFWLRLYIV